jgi:hypothetical protein
MYNDASEVLAHINKGVQASFGVSLLWKISVLHLLTSICMCCTSREGEL